MVRQGRIRLGQDRFGDRRRLGRQLPGRFPLVMVNIDRMERAAFERMQRAFFTLP